MTRRVLAMVLMALPAVVVRADYIMGAPEVNASLKTMTLLRRESDQIRDPRARAETLAKLAKEANYLVSLINMEIRSHGFDQKQLIDLAVGRCEELGVVIRWDSGKDRYLYDQGEYADYLRLHPSGPHDREARFLVLETTFYAQKSDDAAGITALIADIERYRARYRRHERRGELELFLAVLYRDLWRLRKAEPGGGRAERAKTEAFCRALIARDPTTQEARVAEAILKNLQ